VPERIGVNMNLNDEIVSILRNDELDKDSSESSKPEAIEELIEKFGWNDICIILLKILEDKAQSLYWRIIAEVIWGAVLDGRNLPINKVIALLYFRFNPETCSEDDNNLIWGITSKLKKVDYMSEYNPLKDPEVISELSNFSSAEIA
jgi:hypothetical protein